MTDRTDALRRLVEASVAADADAIAEVVTADVSGWSPNLLVRSRDELLEVLGDLDEAFTNVESVIDAVDQVGDKTIAEWHLSADHTGPLTLEDGRVVAPTHRRFHLAGATFAEFDGAKICAFRHYFDDLALLEQSLSATDGDAVLSVDDAPDPADIADLDARLNAHLVASTGHDDAWPLAVLLRDARGALVAGVHGWTWGGCCELLTLWVDESIRGHGLGRALLHRAEAEARQRGCAQVVLLTHAVHGPGFYLGSGYELVASVEGYPEGSAASVAAQAAATDPACRRHRPGRRREGIWSGLTHRLFGWPRTRRRSRRRPPDGLDRSRGQDHPGGPVAGGSSIDAVEVDEWRGRHLDHAPGGAVQVERHEQERGEERSRQQDERRVPSEQRDVARQQREGGGGGDQLEHEDRCRHAVVHGCHPHGLHVDHLVEALDVQPGRGVLRRGGQRVAGQRPQLALQPRPPPPRGVRRSIPAPTTTGGGSCRCSAGGGRGNGSVPAPPASALGGRSCRWRSHRRPRPLSGPRADRRRGRGRRRGAAPRRRAARPAARRRVPSGAAIALGALGRSTPRPRWRPPPRRRWRTRAPRC